MTYSEPDRGATGAEPAYPGETRANSGRRTRVYPPNRAVGTDAMTRHALASVLVAGLVLLAGCSGGLTGTPTEESALDGGRPLRRSRVTPAR